MSMSHSAGSMSHFGDGMGHFAGFMGYFERVMFLLPINEKNPVSKAETGFFSIYSSLH
jgi:hypothetical protein